MMLSLCLENNSGSWLVVGTLIPNKYFYTEQELGLHLKKIQCQCQWKIFLQIGQAQHDHAHNTVLRDQEPAHPPAPSVLQEGPGQGPQVQSDQVLHDQVPAHLTILRECPLQEPEVQGDQFPPEGLVILHYQYQEEQVLHDQVSVQPAVLHGEQDQVPAHQRAEVSDPQPHDCDQIREKRGKENDDNDDKNQDIVQLPPIKGK